LLEANVPLASKNETSSPVAGEAGRVTVIGLDVVLARI
jgi:histone H3/H4